MRVMRSAVFVYLLFLSCLLASAQTATPATPSASPEDPEKRAQLDKLIQQSLDEMSTAATSLRLPENRAIVYALVGDMFWQYDQKRARDLFRNSGAELAAFNADVDRQQANDARRPQRFNDISLGGDPRYQVIPIIAKRDASLAMQIMLQTRRSDVATAMNDTSRVNGQRGGRGGGNFPADISGAQEIALQQQIANFAADQDPDLAAKLIKDSMANGVSSSVLPLLQKLAKLDDKKASDIGTDVVRKVVDADMVQSSDQLRAAISFLQYSTKAQSNADASAKQFNFTDQQQKDLTEKLIATLMAMPQTQASNNWFAQVIPLVDVVEPGRSQVLKQRQAEIQGTTSAVTGRNQQRQNFFNSNTTPEQILAQLPTLPEAERGPAYMALGNKLATLYVTDDAAAQKIIDQVSDNTEKTNLQQQLDSTRASRAIQAGQLEDARKQIASISDKHQQLQRYVSLAIAYDKSGKEEDVKTAKSILRDARALTPAFPDSGDDLADLMELVRGYAVVEPDSAFKIAEPGLDLLNEYVQATGVLSKFNRDRTFRNGELVFRPTGGGYGGFGGGGNSILFRYVPQMQALGKADLERANQMLDRFSRPDARMILRLYVLQGAIPPPPAQPPPSSAR